MTAALFRLDGIGFAYPTHGPVLADLDFALEPGERVALVGGNGVGKTTLLRIMVGLARPAAGTVFAFGAERSREADYREVRRRAGFLFQDPDDQLFCPTVLEDVCFGPLNLGLSPREARDIAERTLDALGLSAFAPRVTHRLSGGEKRLVSLAAVLAMEPEVLLLDEPTNALDDEATERLLGHLKRLPQAMVLATHDRAAIAALATRAVLLKDRRLMPAAIHAHPHTHVHVHPHVHPLTADEPDPMGHGSHDHGSHEHDVVHAHAHSAARTQS